MREWYTAHPDSKEEPSLQYPVTVVFEEGETVVVNNEEEMKRVYKSCE